MRHTRIQPAAWPFVVACVSDTHVPRRARSLPPELLRELAAVGPSLILHAGDLVVEEVLADLGAVARVEAVAGNMDPFPLAGRLPRAAFFTIGPWRIGLVHGDRGAEPTTPERALRTFAPAGHPGPQGGSPEPPGVDVVVFGHSHRPLRESREGVLLLNPGSPTDPSFAPWPSFGLLTLPGPDKGGKGALPPAEIVRLESPSISSRRRS